MDDKLRKIIFIVLGAFVLLFLFLFLISSCSKKMTPESLETKIIDSAKSYYKYHEDELPGENTVLTLSLQDLSNKGIINELDKILDKDTNCSGTLTIENNNNYYMYSPLLNCTTTNDTFNTINLKETLLENVVTSGNGLYSVGNDYYFKGDKVNNYLIFDGLLWRITKVNNDNSIRIIEAGRREPVVWDDRYNAEMSSTVGINNYTANGLNSRIKDTLDDIYNSKDEKNGILTNDAKGFIKETSLCIGKRGIEDNNNDGSIECSSKLDNQYIGLLQLNEYILASLDENCVNANSTACSNYNYLADFSNSYWTITANSENTSQVYKINNTVMSTGASNAGMSRMVINISENTNVKGTGTENDPYVVVGMDSEIREVS